MVQELMPNLTGNLMAMFDREIRPYRNIDVCQQSMAQPPDPHFADILHPFNSLCLSSDLVNNVQVYAVEEQPIPYLVTPRAEYIPELGGSNTVANVMAASSGARQIVNMMEMWK